jgi:hypothetical protein
MIIWIVTFCGKKEENEINIHFKDLCQPLFKQILVINSILGLPSPLDCRGSEEKSGRQWQKYFEVVETMKEHNVD